MSDQSVRADSANEVVVDDSILKVTDLSFGFANRTIYNKLSFSIPKGQITAIMGPSGIGKTTLLRLIGGELEATGGHIVFDGVDITGLKRSGLMQLRRRMGILFQQGALFSDLNVYENVAFLLREHTDLPEDMINDLVLMRLESVGLRGAAELRVNNLSGGMARRVAMARALMLDPELMLYDEPFTGQDPITRAVLLRLIKALNDSLGMSSIIVSHDVDEVNSIADYVYLITKDGIIAEGTPQELIASTDLQVTQFVAGQADGPVRFHFQTPESYSDSLGLSRVEK